MLNFQSFVVIDIETTGLPNAGGSEILEIGMIYGDYGRGGHKLNKRLHLFIEKDHENLTWSPEARRVLSNYEERYSSGDVPVVSKEEALALIQGFLSSCLEDNNGFKPFLVGKGLYSFLLPMLKKEGLNFSELVDHNGLDFISAFYFEANGRCSLNKICKMLGVPVVGKTVMDDCIMILSCFYEMGAKRNNVNNASWY